jgi:hypothetical protein
MVMANIANINHDFANFAWKWKCSMSNIPMSWNATLMFSLATAPLI